MQFNSKEISFLLAPWFTKERITVTDDSCLKRPITKLSHFRLVFNHSIGMNSRATHLKFACPRMSYYACY